MASKFYDLTKCKGVKDELTALRDTYGLKWSEILEIPRFADIPLPTLSMIYLGKRDVPKKYRKQLGEPETTEVPVCPIHGDAHTYDCTKQTVKAKSEPRRKTKWRDVSTKELLWALANRHAPRWSE